MRSLKVAFVLDDSLDKTDGVQQYVLALGRWLHKEGHEVHYLVGDSRRTDIPNIHSLSKNMHVRFNGNRMSMPLPTRKSAIRQLLQREQFDVLHVQLPYSPWLAHRIIAAASEQTAVIGTFHIMPKSGFVHLASRGLAFWLRRTLKRFDTIFAVSTAAKGFAENVFRLRDVRLLPNVVDVARFQFAKPMAKYRDSIPTIMFLGRLVPRKGCMTLLESVRMLAKKNVGPFRVVVCGTGPLESELKAFVARHELQKIVEFAGYIDESDKPSYVASADIMVFPSTGGESFGIVLIEAMAGGNSVVLAGDNEGYRSVMSERPELLFAPHDTQQLANLMEKFMLDDSARDEVVAWQRSHVRQFDIPVVGEQLLEAYNLVHKNKI